MFTWEIMSWLFKDPNNVRLFEYPVVIMKEMMSWLFKDPIVTVAWRNFNHAQTVKNGLIKLPQMNFFVVKQLIKL